MGPFKSDNTTSWSLSYVLTELNDKDRKWYIIEVKIR